MYKKTITYTDYNGVERTEDFYFNLSKAELMEMELSHPGGFEAWIQRIIKADDTQTLVEVFRDIIGKAYGEKDETGRRFIKSPEMTKAFMETEAYSELYVELITNEGAAAQFINSIVPKIDTSSSESKVNVVPLQS